MADQELVALVRQGVAVWNKWRSEHPRVDIDLSEIDLSGALLEGINFAEANLHKANLSGALLKRAGFDHAILIEAHLKNANLSYAFLIETHLDDADLRQASLWHTILMGTYLKRTDLSEAQVWNTVFGNVDLRPVKGLEVLDHIGSCTIGTDTIARSEGQISEAFLRNAGVQEDFIAYVRSVRDRLHPENTHLGGH